MKIDLGNLPCAGFASQQTDFPTLFAPLGQSARDILEVFIESPITAESFPDANRFCQVIILGHSDRVDTPGLSSEQRRVQELDPSQKRAQSEIDWFFNEITSRMAAQGFTPPPSVAAMQNVVIDLIVCGSADLVHLTPGNNEEQRKDNRRVHFIGTAFAPN